MSKDATRTPWPTDHPDYPRRQLQRRDWLNLDGTWRFCFDPSGEVKAPSGDLAWDQQIVVPFAPESRASGIGDTGFHADAWYEREFDIEYESGELVVLRFGAVDYEARVWVNGQFVGSHRGGHTPFAIDITDALVPGKQTVTVWAHDEPHDLEQARGKQDWQLQPHSIWYPRTTGIWQTVWVERLPSTHIHRLVLMSHLERWEIGCDVVIKGLNSDTLELRVKVMDDERVMADDRYGVVEHQVHRRIALSDPGIDDFRDQLLWSPERPTLLEVDVQLIDKGEVIDEIRSYTALRGIALDRGRFLLNNRPYTMRLVLDQGFWDESLMTPPSDEAIVRDIQLIKEAGFNGVRKHQKIEDPRFLYWADRLGLLVWEEMPSAYRFTDRSIRAVVSEWMEVIERDVDHPCIVVWVPFNESWGVPNLPASRPQRDGVQAMYSLTRTLDPSRPVIGNDGWESSATDILGIHDYDADPQRLLERYAPSNVPDVLVNGWPGGRVLTLEGHPHQGQAIMLTEFGGIAYTPDAPGWGYSMGSSSEDLAAKYSALLEAIHGIPAFAGYCYTQFADTFQEANGLFTSDRQPKFPIEEMRRATVGQPPVLFEEKP